MTKPRKQELVQAAIGYLREHGIADLSLRPLAAAAGTSARLLIYHFGSKEGLLAEVLAALQGQLRDSFAEVSAHAQGRGEAPITGFWRWGTARRNFASLRLLYELQILAAQNPQSYGRYFESNSRQWIELVQSVLPAAERTAAFATLLVAVFDGLFLELMSTGDRRRTGEALDEFVRIVRQARGVRRSGDVD
ncbi:MAG TPA: TetR/AcrR family transcriptional regulator [Steroidobacteraceae bacterium]|nr:TetR/AcrR family transcriptional regulator [Steroidobacteraceae bacterium]